MAKYHIITYGCQMNESDSEKIAFELGKQGNKKAANLESADLVVINVCSVRQSAINRVFSKIKKLKNKKIVLTGCILDKDKKQFKEMADQIWPQPSLETKPEYKFKYQAFVPIMTGCNNFCSYCAVPYTRGREKSKNSDKIIQEIKKLVKNNCKEIILLGQNVNSYASNKTDFPKLLKKINQIPGNFKIKFMTSHPKDMSDKLIQTIAQNKKISKQIHLPVQSGNNQILKKMNRNYTINHYKNLIKKIKKAIPEAEISTDIIVGFPDETQKQFQDTVKLIKEIKFKQIYVAAYSPRPGTVAAKLKDNIPSDEKKKRKRIILDLIK